MQIYGVQNQAQGLCFKALDTNSEIGESGKKAVKNLNTGGNPVSVLQSRPLSHTKPLAPRANIIDYAAWFIIVLKGKRSPLFK